MPWDFWKYDRNNTTLKVAVRKRQLANPLVLPPEPPPDQPPAYQQPQPEDYSIAGIPQDNPLLGVQVTRQGGPPGAPEFNPLSPAPAVPFNAGQTAREAGGAIITAADALGGWWSRTPCGCVD